MTEFRVGDKVKCVSTAGLAIPASIEEGKVYVVLRQMVIGNLILENVFGLRPMSSRFVKVKRKWWKECG